MATRKSDPVENAHAVIAKVEADMESGKGDSGQHVEQLLKAGKLLSGGLEPGTPEGDAARRLHAMLEKVRNAGH